jgi:hypothetical protein
MFCPQVNLKPDAGQRTRQWKRRRGAAMKSTSRNKKDAKAAARYIQRKVVYPCGIKINNALYSHQGLNNYLGTNVLVISGQDCLHVYDTRRKFICTAVKSFNFPKPEIKNAKKNQNKKPYTMEIHESLERIRESKLSDLGLFELSIRGLIPCDVFREIKRRLELVKTFLEGGEPGKALDVVKHFFAYPQKTQEEKL